MPVADSEVILADSFGFCGGVAAADRLVETVARLAGEAGVPVHGLHKIVHNDDVVRGHESNGVIFVETVDQIPDASAVVISAHGVGPETVALLSEKDCEIFDATCPLVIKTHRGAETARRDGEKVIYVCHGKPGEVDILHDEVAGMVGHLDYSFDDKRNLQADPVDRAYLELDEDLTDITDLLSDQGKYRVITQTTLRANDCLRYREEIKAQILARQPHASVGFSSSGDVCRAVADRQGSVKGLALIGLSQIFVITDPGSKNGLELAKLAGQLTEGTETKVYAVANADEAQSFGPIDGTTGITASASTPDRTIAKVAQILGYKGSPIKSQDRVFDLHGDDEETIARRLSALALKVAQS